MYFHINIRFTIDYLEKWIHKSKNREVHVFIISGPKAKRKYLIFWIGKSTFTYKNYQTKFHCQ